MVPCCPIPQHLVMHTKHTHSCSTYQNRPLIGTLRNRDKALVHARTHVRSVRHFTHSNHEILTMFLLQGQWRGLAIWTAADVLLMQAAAHHVLPIWRNIIVRG